MSLNARIVSSGYGANLTTDSVQVSASITVSPDMAFPSAFGALADEVDLQIRDDRLAPVPSVKPRASRRARIEMEDGLRFQQAPLSDWGYALNKPGRYRVSFVFNSITTDWATAHRLHIDKSVSSEVRVVKSYSDIDPHFFPPPVGWSSSTNVCQPTFGRTVTRASLWTGPTLARGRRLQTGDQCFVVYLHNGDTIASGIDMEREIARDGNVLLSEDDDAECGHEHAERLIYESRSKPYRHTEAVLLNMQSGYIVARYQRPSNVSDDVSAEDAIDAPCKLL